MKCPKGGRRERIKSLIELYELQLKAIEVDWFDAADHLQVRVMTFLEGVRRATIERIESLEKDYKCGTVMQRAEDKYYVGPDGGYVREDEIEWECPKCGIEVSE